MVRVCSVVSIIQIVKPLVGRFQRANNNSQEVYFKMFNILIREMEFESSQRFHLCLVRMIKIKKTTVHKWGRGSRE